MDPGTNGVSAFLAPRPSDGKLLLLIPDFGTDEAYDTVEIGFDVGAGLI